MSAFRFINDREEDAQALEACVYPVWTW